MNGYDIPNGLIDAIQAGECVAFVGAGFSAAAGLPQWGELLRRLADSPDVAGPAQDHVRARVADGTGHALDEAAQVLQDALPRNDFIRLLRKHLGRPTLTPTVKNRLSWLKGIPFRSVLTTNFDAVLTGVVPGPKTYRTALRSSPPRWWDEPFWREDFDQTGAPTIKLHGDLEQPASVVLSRLDYRRLLYQDPAYMAFLRAILAQQTILYLGFSFADAYLNELRSEALAMLGVEEGAAPVAYAVVNDVPADTRKHFLKNEAIQVLSYEAPGGNHSGFDQILKAIHDRTNPAVRFGRLLSGARILWVDHQAAFGYNAPVFKFLERSARLGGADPASIDPELDHKIAVDRIAAHQSAGTPYDLVITRWGHEQARDDTCNPIAIGERVLREVRRRDLRVPVLVFASGGHLDENKRAAARLGAQGYFHSFGGILRGIERVFATGVESV